MTEDCQAVRCVECVFLLEGHGSNACTALRTPNYDPYSVFDCSDFEYKNPIEQDQRNKELNKRVIKNIPLYERRITMSDIDEIVNSLFRKC